MLEKLKSKIAETTTKVVHVIKVPQEIREARLELCMSCDSLVPHINMCNMCGCIVNAKTWIPNTSCPLNKWGKHIFEDRNNIGEEHEIYN